MKSYLPLVLLLLVACEQANEKPAEFLYDADKPSLNQRIELINQPLFIASEEPEELPNEPVFRAIQQGIALTPEMDSSSFFTRVIDEDYASTLMVSEGEVVAIAPNVEVRGGINMDGGVLSVCGHVTTSGVYGSGGTIVVNSPGVMDCANLYIREGLTVANYGTILLPEGNGLTIKGQFENYSEIVVERISANEDSKTYNSGTLTVNRDIALNGLFQNEGAITLGNNLYLNTTGVLLNYCGIDVAAKISINGTLINSAYISAGSTVYANVGFEMRSYAVLDVKSIIINDDISNPENQLSVIYYSDKMYHNGGVIDPNVLVTNDLEAGYIPENGCNPGFGTQPQFTLVAELDPPSVLGQKLSATSVQVKDGYAYVSYHLNGEEYSAAIDVINVENVNEPSIVQQFSSPDFDFNELKLDDEIEGGERKMWAIGAQRLSTSERLKSPAVLVEFSLNEQMLSDEDNHPVVDLIGKSGNSVCKVGTKLVVATGSNGGISILDYPLAGQESISLANAKYLSASDDMALCLVAAEGKAELCSFENGDYSHAQEVQALEPIYPYDGKLVVHIDGDNAYVASGNSGLNVFEVDSLSNWQNYNPHRGFANGVSTDDQLVYLANGSDGLLIINKYTMTLLGEYKFEGSANYVSVQDDGLIFLANGRGGLKIIHRNN